MCELSSCVYQNTAVIIPNILMSDLSTLVLRLRILSPGTKVHNEDEQSRVTGCLPDDQIRYLR